MAEIVLEIIEAVGLMTEEAEDAVSTTLVEEEEINGLCRIEEVALFSGGCLFCVVVVVGGGADESAWLDPLGLFVFTIFICLRITYILYVW